MSQPITDEPVTAELMPIRADVEPPDADAPYAERLAEDYESLAALIRSDAAGVVAAMVREWPMPISPQTFYIENGPVMATVQAIRAFRPVAVGEILHHEYAPRGLGAPPPQLLIDIPMRTRQFTLAVPLNLVAGYDGRGTWRYHEALLAELYRREGL